MEAIEESEYKNFQKKFRFLDELLRILELRVLELEIRISHLETNYRSSL